MASVVDVVPAEDIEAARRRAASLLAEHRSSERVEVWRDGVLREEVVR